MQATIDCLRHYKYDITAGPMWCCKRLYDVEEEEEDGSHFEAPLGFDHTSHIFFGFHHGLQDGISNTKIISWFNALLNDVISGLPIIDEVQLGNFASYEQTDRLIQEKKEIIDANPKLKGEMLGAINLKNSEMSLLRKAFPVPKDTETKGKALHLKHILNKTSTDRFFKKCRAEGVTIHAAFTALADMALIDLLKEAGIVQENYTMDSGHVVNVRRYWKDGVEDSLGAHTNFPLLFLEMKTPQNVRENFWDHTQAVHVDFKHQLDKVLLNSALVSSEKHNFADYFQLPQTMPHNYSTSNLGDATSVIIQGEHVHLTHFYRTISVNHTYNTLSHILHTFKGCLIYVMDYNGGTVSTQVAEKYCQKIFSYLEEVIEK